MSDKKWKIEIDAKSIHNSKIYYDGQMLGLIKSIDLSLGVDDKLPTIKVELYTTCVDVQTVNGD